MAKTKKKVKKPSKPTDVDIEMEIATLFQMKPKVTRASKFGDNHHDAIDAQLEVLKKRLSTYGAEDAYPLEQGEDGEDDFVPGVHENVYSAAQEAARWLAGEEQAIPPTENWKELVEK
jgi:hypothetical protein